LNSPDSRRAAPSLRGHPPAALSAPLRDGLQPRLYWIAWAFLAALAALPPALAEDPEWFDASLAILAVVGPAGATLVWALRLHNAGWSGWWAVLVLLVFGGGLIVVSDLLIRQAGHDPRELSDEAVWEVMMPALGTILIPAATAVTLVLGLLPVRRGGDAERRQPTQPARRRLGV
jgi:uncharacterized membrane protein YhaH (DUF805 family)